MASFKTAVTIHPDYSGNTAPDCRFMWCGDTNGGMAMVQITPDVHIGFQDPDHITKLIGVLVEARAKLAALKAAQVEA